MACILLWSSAVMVHDSQAYRKVDVTRERISRISELKDILLSFQTVFYLVSAAVASAILESISGFSLVNAAVVCAILESISGLEPSSVITESKYLKLVTVSSFCPFILISCVDATGVVCHQLGLLGTDLLAVGCGGFAEMLN